MLPVCQKINILIACRFFEPLLPTMFAKEMESSCDSSSKRYIHILYNIRLSYFGSWTFLFRVCVTQGMKLHGSNKKLFLNQYHQIVLPIYWRPLSISSEIESDAKKIREIDLFLYLAHFFSSDTKRSNKVFSYYTQFLQ